MYSRRHDGSLTGYHPNAGRRQQPLQEQQAPAEPTYEPWNQPAAYQQEPMVGQGPVQQPAVDMYGYAGYQQPWGQPEQPAYMTQQDFSGYQPVFQNPPANQPGSPFAGYQAQQPTQPPQPAQPQQPVPDNISYMPGAKEAMHTVRVAQVTGVAECYKLMENLRNNETVVVNLDLVPDNAEIDRCLDLLYGACYALQCQFNQISQRNVYLLTPGSVHVQNAENLQRQSELERDNRWPDPGNLAYRQRVAAREQSAYSYGQSSYAPSYPSYGSMGRRVGSRSSAMEYTDFGGFPNAGRF